MQMRPLLYVLVVLFVAQSNAERRTISDIEEGNAMMEAMLRAVESQSHKDNPSHVDSHDVPILGGYNPLLSEVCYDDVGCFSTFVGFYPDSPEELDVSYHLYTRRDYLKISWNDTIKDHERLHKIMSARAIYNTHGRFVVVAHGFLGSADKQWMIDLKDAILNAYRNDVVVLLIDWSLGAAGPNYAQAAANVEMVARLSVHKVLALMKESEETISASDIHFIGFSLGGQMSGYFAKYFTSIVDQKIGRLTALDTAAPLFEEYGIHPTKEDADLVEAVHTSAGGNMLLGKVGVVRPYGHIDYYVNGGYEQPGCPFYDVSCCHGRAYEYLVEALNNLDKCRYEAFLCETVEEAMSKSCKERVHIPYLGALDRKSLIDVVSKREANIIYVKTAEDTPFCR